MIGNWLDWASGPRAQAAMLLVGLGALALSLVVLMLTRWGQVKPLSKCIALSIFAHILLLAYAYGVRLFGDPPVRFAEPVITVTLAPAESASSPEPLEEDSQQENPSAEPSKTPVPSESRQPDHADTGEPRSRLLAPSSLDAPPSPSPEAAGMPRLPLRTSEWTPRRAMETAQVPDVFDGAEDVPQLSDRALESPQPEALASDHDHTEQASNQAARSTAVPADARPAVGDDALPLVPVVPTSVDVPLDSRVAASAIATRQIPDARDVPERYRARVAPNRDEILLRNGGGPQTEAAVDAALRWLAANQQADGRWDSSLHDGGRETKTLGHDRHGAGAEADSAITGLAILAFLAAGHTHLDGEFQEHVRRGLEYLLRIQAADGDLGGRARLFARMYCHGMATLALSEAYAMTRDERLRPYVERAVRFTVRAQDATSGGWRYQPGDPGDMSQFGWQLMALQSADLAGIPIRSQVRAGMIRFLNSVAAGPHRGLASYRPGARPSRTMTAEALVCRLFLRNRLDAPAEAEAIAFLMHETPRSGPMNLYYWYYATLALFQTGGPAWDAWNQALQERLLGAQETVGAAAGSWSPRTVWGGYGGRVYSTALATLCLEVYYRYLPVLE